MGHFIALSDIVAPEKIRMLLHMPSQGAPAHAPLPALIKAAFTRDQGTNWRQYADGTLVQWGQGQGVDPLVTFPRQFDTACWHVSLTCDGMAGANRLVVHAALNVTRFSFTAQGRFIDFSNSDHVVGGSTTTGFHWLAWGA